MTHRARLTLRPTALGGKGLMLFAALELAFFATSYSNLFFLLLAFCCVLGAVGLLATVRNVRGLQAVAFDAPLAAAGAPRQVAITLDGGARRRFGVDVVVPTGGGPCGVGTAMAVDGPTLLHGALTPLRRGVHEVGHVRLSSSFPFGLFEARLEVPTRGELVTWPAAPRADAPPGGAADPEGDEGNAPALPGRGASWSGLREFRSGDAIGDVHWKATARRGTAIVKEREREQAETAQVVLDRRLDEATFERALVEAAALVLAAADGGGPVTLHSQGASLHVGAERVGLDAALRWLAGAERLPADAAAPPRRPGARALPRPPGGRR
ncbi:MAG: DUF58 domain-containing protein [Planctomycetes bacterium]|nr:DUF58 domain-containing protein [Planctomycetota bacterium]